MKVTRIQSGSIADTEKINDKRKNIADLLAMPNGDEVAFNPPCLSGDLYRAADVSRAFFCPAKPIAVPAQTARN